MSWDSASTPRLVGRNLSGQYNFSGGWNLAAMVKKTASVLGWRVIASSNNPTPSILHQTFKDRYTGCGVPIDATINGGEFGEIGDKIRQCWNGLKILTRLQLS